MGYSYKDAGVDVTAGYESVKLISADVKRTFRKEVMGDIGGFGGLFSLASFSHMEEPILLSGTDGVGTKLKLAFLMDKHDTVGIDCVAMCVNDIICNGAEPLFFLDYIACGKNNPPKIAQIVHGVAEGCKLAGAALIGGETAEMPGFYPENEYDLAGFAVGIVDRKEMIDGSTITPGDVVIGLPSSGIHSNGYSLVRKIFEPLEENLDQTVAELGQTLGETLLTPTRIYVSLLQKLKKQVKIKGISHITGGGFIENLPRCLPKHAGLGIRIQEGTWPVPPIFSLLQKQGGVEPMQMFGTFNMGIGMALVVDAKDADDCLAYLEKEGEKAYQIGQVVSQEKEVELCLQ